MNITLENKFEKINKTFVLLLLISMVIYSLYNTFNYKPTTYYKPAEKIYFSNPVVDPITGDTLSK